MTDPRPQSAEMSTTRPATGQTEPCRTCGRPVGAAAEHHPFCSRRCRDVDLGNWLSGNYRITRELKDADLDTMD